MKRIKIFTVALIAAIGLAALPTMVQDFLFGFSMGYSQAERHTCDVLQIPVRPNGSDVFAELPDVKLDGSPAQVAFGTMDISIPDSFFSEHRDRPAVRSFLASETALLVVSLLGLAVTVWVAVLLVRVLYSVLRTRLFEPRNLRRISLMGWMLLSLEAAFGAVQCWQLKAMCGFVDLGGYHVNFTEVFNADGIVMAVTILLMNELLRIAVSMKEEQDLTI